MDPNRAGAAKTNSDELARCSRRRSNPPETSPPAVDAAWAPLAEPFARLVERHPRLERTNNRTHLGTGDHFVEICIDETGTVWALLHSGSRGVGNAIGSHFIELAKEDMRT